MQVGVRPPLDQHQQILARRLVLVLAVAALLVRWYLVLALAALLRLRLLAGRRQVADLVVGQARRQLGGARRRDDHVPRGWRRGRRRASLLRLRDGARQTIDELGLLPRDGLAQRRQPRLEVRHLEVADLYLLSSYLEHEAVAVVGLRDRWWCGRFDVQKRAGALGVGVVLAQCFSGASYVVAQRPLLRAGYSPLVVSGGAYVLAALATALVGGAYFAALGAKSLRWRDSSAPALLAGALLFSILGATVYNYVVIAWATGRLGATSVTLFTLLQFPFAAAAEFALFGARVGGLQVGGSAAIFGGLVLVVCPARAGDDPSYVDTREAWAAALPEPEREAPEGGYRALNAETGASEPATPGHMPERAIAARSGGDGPG